MSDIVEFDEERILQFIRPNRWVSKSIGNYKLFAFNWVVSGVASVVLWLIVILFLAFPDDLAEVFNVRGKPWVSQNFTWLYIFTQDIWAVFLLWLCCSKYGRYALPAAFNPHAAERVASHTTPASRGDHTRTPFR